MGSNKQQRRKAARAERERRWREAESLSPLQRAELQALVDFVAEEVMTAGHRSSFALTEAWLERNGRLPEPVLEFLTSHGVEDDYSLLIRGDSFTLFGPTAERIAWMPIERPDLEALVTKLRGLPCDETHRETRAFLERRGLPVSTTLAALLAQGGGCDCEVVLNVDPDLIYPPSAPIP